MDEKKYPYIYLDLDETLIYTQFSKSEPKDVEPGSLTFKMGDYWYNTQLRACAKDLIATCRRFSIVRILTAASRPYAKTISDHFELGFDHEEIFDRYNFCHFVSGGWCSGDVMVANESIGHVNSILVDNQEPDLPTARVKREWLGITKDRYVEFPYWEGGPECPTFIERYKEAIDTILVLVTEKKF